MQIRIIRSDGSLDLAKEARVAGFEPGIACTITVLPSTGNLLIQRTASLAAPGDLDLTPLLAAHGRRALPRRALTRAQKGVDDGEQSE